MFSLHAEGENSGGVDREVAVLFTACIDLTGGKGPAACAGRPRGRMMPLKKMTAARMNLYETFAFFFRHFVVIVG